MNSIRNHLTLLLLVGAGLLSVGGGFLAYRTVHRAVMSEFDYSLRTKVHDLSTMTEWEDDHYEFEFVDKRMPEFERREHPEYYQVKVHGGPILFRSPSLGTAELAGNEAPPSMTVKSYDLMLSGGLPGRAAALSVKVDGTVLDLVVARDTLRLKHLFRFMAAGYAGATLLLLSVLVFGINQLVKRGLRPLTTFTAQATAIDSGTLNTRFSLPDLPEELRPIALQLDRMLDRIATAFQRERYLTAAMAHELYTPIAELRSLTEVALKWPEDSDGTVPEQAHAIALQMQEMVNALLSLARCEAGLQSIELAPVDVVQLLDEQCRGVEKVLREKQITANWGWLSGPAMLTDRAMLNVILRNLFRNAAEYTPPGGSVSGEAVYSKEGYTVTLSNTQNALDAEDLEHLFEPLWRKDKARSGSAHSGLGLAVTSRFCAQLDIQLNATLSEPGGFQITMEIPSKKQSEPEAGKPAL